MLLKFDLPDLPLQVCLIASLALRNDTLLNYGDKGLVSLLNWTSDRSGALRMRSRRSVETYFPPDYLVTEFFPLCTRPEVHGTTRSKNTAVFALF